MALGLQVATQGLSKSESYEIRATFDNIGGLKVQAPLKIGGVVIGRVTAIELDPQTYLPEVKIAIDKRYNQLPDNSSLSIKTSGLLGEQYISLSVGFDDRETTQMLKEGSKVVDTKPAWF